MIDALGTVLGEHWPATLLVFAVLSALVWGVSGKDEGMKRNL
ncbi:MAG TPA: hypothetical protein VMT67_01140 [Terriglobales bacterium]|nr:hypothetical protein [Terriglobales bacterium]